ncbi:hypothetical protein SKAU_G00099640 [Synaphobranchus kaupii]|uniref:Uncharacterized protein n=1 Tax=Synaphobranchus kaupii TaxID=118154 RepID=A0A9Q1FZA4_SYNKA|nr:hypothetical protein SKAU_G00099640 [Synaphobranchus kaupii]
METLTRDPPRASFCQSAEGASPRPLRLRVGGGTGKRAWRRRACGLGGFRCAQTWPGQPICARHALQTRRARQDSAGVQAPRANSAPKCVGVGDSLRPRSDASPFMGIFEEAEAIGRVGQRGVLGTWSQESCFTSRQGPALFLTRI